MNRSPFDAGGKGTSTMPMDADSDAELASLSSGGLKVDAVCGTIRNTSVWTLLRFFIQTGIDEKAPKGSAPTIEKNIEHEKQMTDIA